MATIAEFKRVTQEVVAEFGEEYIYPGSKNGSCYYGADFKTPEDEVAPSCIIGQIAYRLDPVAFQRLVSQERGKDTRDDDDELVSESDLVRSLIDSPIGYDAIDKVWETQRLQDSGVPWGEAAATGILSIEED